MDFFQLTRGLIISLVLGLLFTLWVNPGTTGGLLLLLAVSTGVIYLAATVIHLTWLAIHRGSRGASAPAPFKDVKVPFTSRRSNSDIDEGGPKT